MRELFSLAMCAWTVEEQAEEAISECSRLSAAIAVFMVRRLRHPGSTARVASAIADMEIMLQRLRMVIGSDLVDLEKTESLFRLQARVTAAAQSTSGGTNV